MRISDWSSDVCSSDLQCEQLGIGLQAMSPLPVCERCCLVPGPPERHQLGFSKIPDKTISADGSGTNTRVRYCITSVKQPIDLSHGRRSCGQPTSSLRGEPLTIERSEEHTSELQSLMRNSYAVF